MAKSLSQVNAQIARLQKEADALKAKEVAGVVSRIKDAIAIYGLTPADLFGDSAEPAVKARRAVAAKRVAGKKTPVTQAAQAKGAAPSPIKFRDDAGHTWTGHGKRPNWFKAAIDAGKKPEDLAV